MANLGFEPRPLRSEATLLTLNGVLPPLSLHGDKAVNLNPQTLQGPYRMGSGAESCPFSLPRAPAEAQVWGQK